MLHDIVKHVQEFIGPLLPPYDHEFAESASRMEFMLHLEATIFYHRDIIGTKSTVQVWGWGGGWVFQNAIDLAVISENAGPGAVLRGSANGMPPSLLQNYISRLDARK